MGVRTTASDPAVALYDSVTGTAFGPVFANASEADDFLRYTADAPDLRTLEAAILDGMYRDWYAEYFGEDEDS